MSDPTFEALIPSIPSLNGVELHPAVKVKWEDGFVMIMPSDPIILEDLSFRPGLVRIVNERRAAYESVRDET